MKFGTRLRAAATCMAITAGVLTPAAFADNFTVAFEAAGVQTPNGTPYYETFGGSLQSDGTYKTTFNGSGITGTYASTTGDFYLTSADQYGGAGGTGSYITTDYLSSTTLTLSQQVTYFGLWFSALDSGNVLSFYNNGTLVETFTAPDYVADINDALGCPGSAYCGNPNFPTAVNTAPGDLTQQFAYINLTDTNGTFNEVVFSQVAGNSYGRFEADNNAVLAVAPGSTPEPSSLVLLGTGITAMAGAVRRRIRK